MFPEGIWYCQWWKCFIRFLGIGSWRIGWDLFRVRGCTCFVNGARGTQIDAWYWLWFKKNKKAEENEEHINWCSQRLVSRDGWPKIHRPPICNNRSVQNPSPLSYFPLRLLFVVISCHIQFLDAQCFHVLSRGLKLRRPRGCPSAFLQGKPCVALQGCQDVEADALEIEKDCCGMLWIHIFKISRLSYFISYVKMVLK